MNQTRPGRQTSKASMALLFTALFVVAACSPEQDIRAAGSDAVAADSGAIEADTAVRDGWELQPVRLQDPANSPDRSATAFTVGVGSCNGDPTFIVTESATEIVIAAESWIPTGNGRDGCQDGISVELAAPIGDRTIIDELTETEVRLLTDEEMYAPSELQQIDCAADAADCRAAFDVFEETYTPSYTLTCIGVPEDRIGQQHFAAGELNGEQVDAYQIRRAGVNLLLAVSVPSGDCSQRAIGPIEGAVHPWSVAVHNDLDSDQRSRILCLRTGLSPAQEIEERCDRFVE